MSNLLKPRKMSATEKKAAVYSKGYAQGQADLMANVDPETRKLNAEATNSLLIMWDAERAVGDKRNAHNLGLLLEWCGDPDTVKNYQPRS